MKLIPSLNMNILTQILSPGTHALEWCGGRAFTSGGGGGCQQSPPAAPPPRQKRAQLTGPPKTCPGTSMVPMAVVFVFKDTRPPLNSGYMYVTPHHGLPLEPQELVRVITRTQGATNVKHRKDQCM